jgi:hypothetical protein
MSRENTIKKLLSPEMYQVYVSMAQGGLIANNDIDKPNETDDALNLKQVIQDVTTIGALIMKRAIKYTPVKTGELRKSIYIKNIGSGVAIGYSKDYAIYVHEIGFYYHKSPTKYKFLEDAAFEVALETNTPYRISISYDPLEVYVNVPNLGADLVTIKAREKVNRLISRKNKVWQDFINYDDSKATESEKLYHEKMEQFFNYWRALGYGDWWILDEWQDRNRHD